MTASLLTAAGAAHAEVTLNHTFSLESDLRLVVDKNRGATSDQLLHFNWNRNAVEYKVQAFIGEDVRAVGHLRTLFFGIHEIEKMNDLVDRRQMDPVRIDSDAAFLEVKGLVFDDLSVKLGRMIHTWGTADQFSPTDNINPKDFEDPLRFGGKLANQMAVATYYLPWLSGSIQAVWIPMFRPTQLPASSALGMSADNVSQMPVRDPGLKQALIDEYYREKGQGASLFMDPEIRVNMPPTDLDNMSGGVRTKFRLGEYDLSASYFRGRHSFPVPKRIYSYSGKDVRTAEGLRTEQRQFIDLVYPRIQVIGLDFAASLPWLFNLGVWFDGAAIHPEKVDMLLYTTNYRPGDPCATPGMTGSDIRLACSRNSDYWYYKMTAGFDYTFTSWLYMNVQYLHGFDDEFGYEDALDDFIAGGVDLKFLNDQLLLRLFTLHDITDGSDILFPQFILNKWDSTELQLGAIFNLGAEDTKFGQKASGRNMVFTKVKVGF
ncbi:MAG: hypothetical protein HY897_19670 [Deltaproteobacteria bacterium]|nr:hypothetical protein [Deltaproteobacteria bacterium]